jgi:uncharacterized protein
MTVLDQHINSINRLCSTYRVRHLYAFGSVLTEKFNTKSDIDLVVDFEPIDVNLYADNYYDFKFSLQDILKRPIDLLEEKAIKNPYFKQSINKQRQLIYGH